jgi:hypothetical protein
MARVSRSREEKARFVAAWRVSGIGLHRFARENPISPKLLREWMALEASPPAVLPVAVVERAGVCVSPPSLVVELAGVAHRVEVPVGFDAAQLRPLVDALC